MYLLVSISIGPTLGYSRPQRTRPGGGHGVAAADAPGPGPASPHNGPARRSRAQEPLILGDCYII